MRKKLEEPTQVQCTKCNDIINSTFEGEYVQCRCGECFVDETSYYIRVGGAAKYLKELPEHSK